MKRIKTFNQVRDIHYRLATSSKEQGYGCEEKHKMLEGLLKRSGLRVRPRICENKWSDFTILPNEIQRIPHNNLAIHSYLEVEIKGNWYKIDASMDSGLKSILPINEWDGKTDTALCVNPTKTYTPKRSLREWKEEGDYTEYFEKNGPFLKAVNKFLQITRSTHL